jgi:predicted amidohydrolase
MICYDLRFPVWSRNRDDYDLLIYVANWPSRRHHAWETLLRARAIENLSYVVGVNRVGTDGNDLPYVGGSAVIDYLGQEVADLGDRVGTTTSTLDLEQLEKFRDRFAFHKDADAFQISG